MPVCLVAHNKGILKFQVVAIVVKNILMMWNILRCFGMLLCGAQYVSRPEEVCLWLLVSVSAGLADLVC